jgi:hypothetical protein
LGAVVKASEVPDEPADHLPNSFGHPIEALEIRLSDVAEIECDVKVTLHFHG